MGGEGQHRSWAVMHTQHTHAGVGAVVYGACLQLDRGFAVVHQMVLEAPKAEPLALAANDDVRPQQPAPRWHCRDFVAFVEAKTVAVGVGVARQRDSPPPHQA